MRKIILACVFDFPFPFILKNIKRIAHIPETRLYNPLALPGLHPYFGNPLIMSGHQKKVKGGKMDLDWQPGFWFHLCADKVWISEKWKTFLNVCLLISNTGVLIASICLYCKGWLDQNAQQNVWCTADQQPLVWNVTDHVPVTKDMKAKRTSGINA